MWQLGWQEGNPAMAYTVLVVEDDESNMLILATTLGVLGHHVLQAFCPTTGLKMARQLRPDVILMDLMFKGAPFDGLEAIRQLKRNPLTCGIPIVAQTASVLSYTEQCVRRAGAHGLLQKPFARRQLVAALEAAMCIRHSRPPIPRYHD